MKRSYSSKVIICFCAAGYLFLVISYQYCQISKKLQRIVKKINNGEVYSLSRAVRIIESVPSIKKKFKVWRFFYNNVKANKLIMESIKHSIWQYLYQEIHKSIIDGIDRYKVCSFSVSPTKFQYAYFPRGNLLYVSMPGISSNEITCSDNVKIVDEIKYVVYEGYMMKAIVYANKQRWYVNVENKYLFGPYKNVDYIYFDNDYKNYAFLYNNGTGLIFNGKKLKLKHSCISSVGIFKNKVYLVCNSRKYRNSQFLYFNKSSVLCNKNTIYFVSSKNGDIAFVCYNKNLRSIFFNNKVVKRYIIPKAIGDLNIYNLAMESKYLSYSIGMHKINGDNYLTFVYDTKAKKMHQIASDCSIIFLKGSYFHCKVVDSNLVIYKNNEKFKEIKIDSYFVKNSISMLKISKYAFYLYFYNQKNGTYRYFIVQLDGTLDVIDYIRDFSTPRQESKGNGKIFIINAIDSNNRYKCYIYNGKKKIVKNGYHCYYYDKNFKSFILVQYNREEDKSEVYIEKYKRMIEVKGWVPYNIYDWYFLKGDDLLYLVSAGGNEQVFYIPIVDKKTFVVATRSNVIFPLNRVNYYHDFTYYMPYINFNGLYLLPELPITAVNKIEKIAKFCKYQKRLCGVN